MSEKCNCDKYQRVILSLVEDSPKFAKMLGLVREANTLLDEAHWLMYQMGIDEKVADNEWPIRLADAFNRCGEVLVEIDPRNKRRNTNQDII